MPPCWSVSLAIEWLKSRCWCAGLSTLSRPATDWQVVWSNATCTPLLACGKIKRVRLCSSYQLISNHTTNATNPFFWTWDSQCCFERGVTPETAVNMCYGISLSLPVSCHMDIQDIMMCLSENTHQCRPKARCRMLTECRRLPQKKDWQQSGGCLRQTFLLLNVCVLLQYVKRQRMWVKWCPGSQLHSGRLTCQRLSEVSKSSAPGAIDHQEYARCFLVRCDGVRYRTQVTNINLHVTAGYKFITFNDVHVHDFIIVLIHNFRCMKSIWLVASLPRLFWQVFNFS